MDAGFIQYLAESRGFQPGDTIATKQQYDALYKEYLKQGSGGFQPQIVEVPVPGSTNSERAFMSSPNSATLMRDPQSRARYEVGNDGNLYMIDGTSASVVTNTVGGAPIQPNPKSSAFADMMGLMGQQAPAQPEPGFIARLLGRGGQAAPTPEPTPMPTPEQRPAEPAGPTMGTNAPTAAPTPAVFSVEQFQQMTGEPLPPGDYQDAQGRPFSIR